MHSRPGTDVNVAWVFSFHSGPAADVYEGRKSIEFRRGRAHVKAGDRILVYEVAPTAKITGAFNVAKVHHGTPAEVLALGDRATADVARPYLDGATVATALELRDVLKAAR